MILLANLHLVTGYAGAEHVRAVDQGAFNAALIGTGQFVLDKGNVLKAQVISNNTVRVLDGELMMQGRFVRLNPGTYVDLAIENGAQGMKRNDLIVARYTKDTVTGVEECNLVVIKGTATASNPHDPAYTEGDITNGNSVRHDFPLWRLPITNLNVGTPVSLFGDPFMDSMRTLPEIRAAVNAIHSEVDKQLAKQDKEVDAKIAAIDSYLKPEELSAATKSLYGLGSSAVPDNVFSLIHSHLLKKVEMEIVSYKGTGNAGKNNPTSVTFSKAPSLIIMLGYKDTASGQWHQMRYNDYDYLYMLPTSVIPTAYTRGMGFGHERNYYIYGKKGSDGKTFSWYSYDSLKGDGEAAEQCNSSGCEYYVLGLITGTVSGSSSSGGSSGGGDDSGGGNSGGGSSSGETITFRIDGETFTCTSGMTWAEWISESGENVVYIDRDDAVVGTSTDYYLTDYNGAEQSSENIIESDMSYYTSPQE